MVISFSAKAIKPPLYPCANSACFCIQINEVGELTILWDQNNLGISNFFEHQFYADTGTGYIYIGSINDPTINTFTYPNYYAANDSSTYYIKTYYGTGGSQSMFSDTISSIYFDLVNQFDGTVYLNWNHPMHSDSLPANSYYVLEKSYPTNPPTNAVWNHVKNLSKDSTSTIESIDVCAEWINYRVKLITDNCTFISNIDGGYIQDQQAPDPPVLNEVTNDTLNDYMQINWSPSLAMDVSAYIVFKFNNGIWAPIDTVYGRLSNQYVDTSSLTFSNQVVQYAIAAMDSCSYGIPPQYNTSPAGLEHQNINLTSSYNQCTGIASLNWNPYINWTNGLDNYEIYVKNELSSWVLASTTTNTSFDYFIQNGNLNYSFIVKAKALSDPYSSLSNQIDFYALQNPIPQYSYLSNVNVVEDTIEVTYQGENGAGVKEVRFYKSDNNGISYNLIHNDINPLFPYTYKDFSVDPNNHSYMYQVSVIDACDNEVGFSNIGTSILLSVNDDDYVMKLLHWNPYRNWEFGVDHYEILANVNLNPSFQSIAVVDSTDHNFEHDIGSFIVEPFNGLICYKIKAKEVLNSFNMESLSESNTVCIQQQPMVSIPNAIYIGGINELWKPVMNLHDFTEYKVSIFNRLGQLVYELNDYNQFWDGTYQATGKLASVGVYIYWMEFKTVNGEYFNRKGHITLIR